MHRIIRFLIGLLGTVGAIQALGQTPVPIAVTGNLTSILGAGQAYAGVSIQLLNCAAPVSIPSYSVIVQQGYQVQADPSGMVNTTVWPNDIISCNGTLGTNKYQLSYVVNGAVQGTPQCYQVLHTQIWNLNTQQPISCDGSAPNPVGAFPGLPSGSIQFANGLAFSGSDTSLDTQGNAIIPNANGTPNIFSCAAGINAPDWCAATITCADIANPSWCSGSPVSPALSTVWLANAIKQLPLQTLGDGTSTVHTGEIDFGPKTWLHIGQPPTETNPSGSPFVLNAHVTFDCKGGGFIVDGPVGLVDAWTGNGNNPKNVLRHKLKNCTFIANYIPPSTNIVSEQTYPFAYGGHAANTVDWVVGSTASFVKNSRVFCEGCLNGLIVGFATNHNPSSIAAITDATHMTTLTLGQNINPWVETSSTAFPITVSNASAGNTQYCESVSLGNVVNWPGQKAVLTGFTNSANNSDATGFTVVSAALNCFTVNNASGVFESNTTGATANVVPPMITDAITYTGTVGTPWVVTAPDANGNQTYTGPNINEAYAGFSTDGKQVVLAGFHNSANNGTFDISGALSGPAGQSLIAVYNPSGVAESGQTEDQSATALVHLAMMKGESEAFFVGADWLGVNSATTAYSPHLTMDNVTTNASTVASVAHEFHFAFEEGNNAYLLDFSNFRFSGADLAPVFDPFAGGAGHNLGPENISFTNGSMGNSDIACIFADGRAEMNFSGVSADYCIHTTHGWRPGNGHVIYGFSPVINWVTGHWESNTPTWYTEWGTSFGFMHASNLIVTSNDKNITIPAMFTLRGTRDDISFDHIWLRSDLTQFVTSWTDSPAGIISHFEHHDIYANGLNLYNLPVEERGITGNGFNSVSGIITTSLYIQASVGDSILINPYPGYTTGTAMTIVASGATGNQVNIGANAAGTMANIASVGNASTDANLSKNTYSSSGPTLTITPKTPGMLESVTVTAPNSQWVVNAPTVSQPQQAETINTVSLQSGVNKNMKTTGITTRADIQPVMTAGQTTSEFFGRDEDTYNGVYYDFSYTDDKNAANYFAMRLAGPSELQSFALASGSHVRLPQILSATGLGTDSSGNIIATSGGGGTVGPNTWIFAAGVNGGVCDDTTDDTAGLVALISTANTAGGGTISYQCNGLFNSAQITVPNNIRITGLVASANGQWAAPPNTALNKMDMRFNATDAKLVYLAPGAGEIDHLNLTDGGSDCVPFILDINNSLRIHDNLFSGTASGTSACNDAIILGGTTTTIGNAAADAFQGYGAYVEHNFFDKIRRGVYLRVYAQAIPVRNNVWSQTCGATSSQAAVEIGTGTGTTDGNIFSGNLFETNHYPYVVWSHASGNQFQGDTFWDASGTTLFLFHFTGGASLNVANIYHDSTITSTTLTDNNQPAGPNSVADQTLQGGEILAGMNGRKCADVSGSSTTQVCNTLTPFTPILGSWIIYTTSSTNTGALTINVNSLGAKSVAKWAGSTTALAAGDIPTGATIPMFYDNVQWEAVDIGNAPSGSGLSGMTATQVAIAGSATTITSSKALAGSGTGVVTGPTSSTSGDVVNYTGTAGQTQDSGTLLTALAPLASPTFTGTPAAPTASGGTSTTQLATTAFVQAAIAAAGTGAGIVTYSGPALTFTGTLYFPIGGGGLSSTTETNVDIDSPAAVTIQNMTVQMSAAPGVGNTIVYTWRKNAADTALTCTISGASATSCSDTTHNFSTASLDLLDIKVVTTGTVIGTPTVVMAAQVGIAASGTTAFSSLSGGMNTTAAMVVGSGASLAVSGSGTIGATSLSALSGLPAQAANTVDMNATGGSAVPTAVAMPTCTTGADLYNTSTHTWSCVSTGGSSGMPFTVIQEGVGASGTVSTSTYTFPQAAQAGGATEWLIVGTGGTTITTPSGWTLDVDNNASYHTAVFHRTSASDTSVIIATGVSTQIVFYYVELSGTRTLDQSATASNTPATNGFNTLRFPSTASITPSSGAWVIRAMTTSSATQPIYQPVIQPTNGLWETKILPPAASNQKSMILTTGNFSATATATVPPEAQLANTGAWGDTSFPAATILFSIK